jgi:hypothetical protein
MPHSRTRDAVGITETYRYYMGTTGKTECFLIDGGATSAEVYRLKPKPNPMEIIRLTKVILLLPW